MRIFNYKITWFFISVVCLIAGYFGYRQFVLYPFALSHIIPDAKAVVQIALPKVSPQDEIHALPLFKQKFSYLGQGHQTYAFLSADGQYVLKFFNFARMDAKEPIEWLPAFPFIASYQDHLKKRREKKFNRLFNGYKVAYENDADNTGVVYVHMQKTQHLQTNLVLIDASKREHQIWLDDTIFVIQRKVQPTRDILSQLLDEGKTSEFIDRIRQLISLYLSEYQRGLYDSDHNIMSNTGFDAHKAYRLDVGRLTLNPEYTRPEIYLPDLNKIIQKRVLKWLEKKYPQYYTELQADIEHILTSLQKDARISK